MASSPKLLLIEPNTAQRELLSDRLAADGWDVDPAESLSQVSPARQAAAEVAVVAIPGVAGRPDGGTFRRILDASLPVGVDIVAVVGDTAMHRALAGNLGEFGIAALVPRPFAYQVLRDAIESRDRSVTATYFASALVLYAQHEGEAFAVGRGTSVSAALADLGGRIEAQMASGWPPIADEIDQGEEVCAIDITLTASPSPEGEASL
jgi:DNA-binding response OmpR family regulator